ncbi:hypothetical protein KCV26_05835 [Petrimonas sulfuriphila]
MNISVSREKSYLLFDSINSVYESTSFIITTNISPAECLRPPYDKAPVTVIRDRLLYKYKLLQLSGKSYINFSSSLDSFYSQIS